MINYMKILLQFGSFKIHFMKIQLGFITLLKISENSVHFSQFQDTFTRKDRKYHLLRYLFNIKILLISENL